MELSVYNIEGKSTEKKVKLDKDIFGVKPNDDAIYLDVKRFLTHQRQGTHKTKERGEIVGSTRKIKKQKGTGTARAGSIKSPIFRGGGRIFGPRPKNYSLVLNKKFRSLARKSALSYKAKEKAIVVIEDFSFDKPRTKDALNIKRNLKLEDKKLLFVLPEENKNIYLSVKNLQKTSVVKASELNTYQIMNSNNIVFLESSVKKVEEVFKS